MLDVQTHAQNLQVGRRVAPRSFRSPKALSNHTFVDLKPAQGEVRQEVISGLKEFQKRLSPKYFYDEAGSRLFEAICRTPEYYVTRTENGIFETHARAMLATLGEDCVLAEPGSGNCEKVRYLLGHGAGFVRRYVAIDIDGATVLEASRRIAAEYPCVEVMGVCANLTELERVPGIAGGGVSSSVLFFPGSTLGNFQPSEALAFLRKARHVLGPSGKVLIGLDRRKDAKVIDAAYNDAQGYTAAFNKNALTHLNAIAGGTFDPASFDHVAFFNADRSRVEMHLRSQRDQVVHVAGVDFVFHKGETIHTENSYKYTPNGARDLARQAGFDVPMVWSDANEWFSIYLLQARA